MVETRIHPLAIPNFLRASNAPPRSVNRFNVERGIGLRVQILKCLAADMRMVEINHALKIKTRSRKHHFRILYQISGAMTPAGLVAWAFRNKLAK